MFFRALIAWWLLLVPALVHAQVDFSPRTGLILLRNGNLLEGEITLAGDYYIVATGKASEIRLPKEQVEGICRNLDDAYLFKLTTMHGTGVKAQFDMAEWCLRQGLYEKVELHLTEAEQQEPKHPVLLLLQQRLKIAREGPEAVPVRQETSAAVLPIDLDQVEASLPNVAVEKFTAVVQPLLMNRCAAGGCHGVNTTSALQIIRPLPGQLIQRRATQRNLITTLKYIDKEQPDRSPLLTVPLAPHGGGKAVFDATSRDQVAALASWVEQTLEPTVVRPASIQPAINKMTSPNGSRPQGPITANLSPEEANNAEVTTGSSKPASPDTPFLPRDPFDPEIFNRRWHNEKRTAKSPAKSDQK